ncbi:hypothetical protein GCK32_015811 [Trichostrongylus colubriformis]|uniref:Uncharacterized protein n=1 Tax=Trichostrongylus colubriformis TaxID=6319 RepID=A0AAN8G2F1_TRICO
MFKTMLHANKTIMDKTLSKSPNLVRLRGVLYEPKCGEPICFHEWFRNRDHNRNPVKQHIELFDAIYPIVRSTIAVNVAGAADRRKLHRAYRVYCHQIFAKITAGDQDTETELSTLKWWMKNATALVEKEFPCIKEFENVFVSDCTARCDNSGFVFTTRLKGVSAVVEFIFSEGPNHEEQWHVSVTTHVFVIGDQHIRKLVKAAIERRMSLCEFIEVLLWPFMERVNKAKEQTASLSS